MSNYKTISALTMIAMLATSTALATAIDFPVGQTNGTFNCTINTINPFATVNIDTSAIEVKGFCANEPYVVAPGHLENIPVSQVNDFFFEINKQPHLSGTVTVTASSGDVTCSADKGERVKAYGKGKYC